MGGVLVDNGEGFVDLGKDVGVKKLADDTDPMPGKNLDFRRLRGAAVSGSPAGNRRFPEAFVGVIRRPMGRITRKIRVQKGMGRGIQRGVCGTFRGSLGQIRGGL